MKLALAIYAAAMTVANLIVAYFVGHAPQMLPVVTGINAFLLIGLDLSMRDWLHMRISRNQMLALIAGSGAITWILNPSAGTIAIASAVAFTSAALVDWAVFSKATGSWSKRANVSNLAGAAVDSVAFSLLAPFPFLWSIVLTQFAAKVAGGYVWTVLLSRKLAAA